MFGPSSSSLGPFPPFPEGGGANPFVEIEELFDRQPLTSRREVFASQQSTRITLRSLYREFIIDLLPHLEVLDGIKISAEERKRSHKLVLKHFITRNKINLQDDASQQKTPTNLFRALQGREVTRLGRSFSSEAVNSYIYNSTSSRPYRYCPLSSRSTLLTPRQFEYHPKIEDLIVFGTPNSLVVVDQLARPKASKYLGWSLTSHLPQPDTILGLSWFKHDPNKFLAGSDSGRIQLFDVTKLSKSRSPSLSGLVATYPSFPRLTCVQGNSEDEFFLASGAPTSINLYDFQTTQIIRSFSDIHEGQINVLRFANHSPHMFATSSFDKTVKYWDVRCPDGVRPLFSQTCERTLLMVCFSPDDRYLLSSGSDNEVIQWDIRRGGNMDRSFNLNRLKVSGNWTRSYYLADGKHVIVGSCMEDSISVLCAQTGRLVQQVELHVPGELDYSRKMYCLSLRGDPHHSSRFSAIVSSPHHGETLNLVSFDICQKMQDFE